MITSVKKPSTDFFTVILHSILLICLSILFLTGLQISVTDPSSGLVQSLKVILPSGNIVQWHAWAGFFLSFISTAYAAYILSARLTARLKINGKLASEIQPSSKNFWRSINILTYWFAFFVIIISVVTGLMKYFDAGFSSNVIVGTIHRVSAWLVFGYMFFHVTAQYFMGGFNHLLKIIKPRIVYVSAAAIASVFGIAAVSAMMVADVATVREIFIPRIKPSDAPKFDGNSTDGVWSKIKGTTVAVTRGANFKDGNSEVTIRGAHDGEHTYWLFEWPDDSRSRKHLIGVKTAEGWKMLNTNFDVEDEFTFYEDKLGVFFSKSDKLAGAGSSQMGLKPLSDKPSSPHGRAMHYTTGDTFIDVWYWKGVRTGNENTNQLDDSYIGPPLAVKEPLPGQSARYKGGWASDPSPPGGGVSSSFQNMPGKTYKDIVRPTFLPKDKASLDKIVARMGKVDLNPDASDDGDFYMLAPEVSKATPELDAALPIGTVLPGIVILGPMLGDRGDVQAVGLWNKGVWRLEIKRKLDTGSKYDVAMASGIHMWVAPFNRSQTRHAYHLHPLRLKLGN